MPAMNGRMEDFILEVSSKVASAFPNEIEQECECVEQQESVEKPNMLKTFYEVNKRRMEIRRLIHRKLPEHMANPNGRRNMLHPKKIKNSSERMLEDASRTIFQQFGFAGWLTVLEMKGIQKRSDQRLSYLASQIHKDINWDLRYGMSRTMYSIWSGRMPLRYLRFKNDSGFNNYWQYKAGDHSSYYRWIPLIVDSICKLNSGASCSELERSLLLEVLKAINEALDIANR